MDHKTMSAQAGSNKPPPLPPRQTSSTAWPPYADAPPSYDSIGASGISSKDPWARQDPRSSSTQSLVPSESNVQNERRRLLLLYLHGFMGNETSFRSFPAHVHNLLTVLLRETHVVYTKIYPRYRSKRNISFARDDFSKWLEPNEDPKTDVVLLGHSMGGLLSAEVVLMPQSPAAQSPLKHRILGTVNFDVPFLGMHPGVVKSGLASIFTSSDETPGDKWLADMDTASVSDGASSTGRPASPSSMGRHDTLWQPGQPDPNFNPSFNNDVILPMRKGWQNALHFMHKHSGHLIKATNQLITSHLEFGGAMANYPELKTRYSRIRALEEEDESTRKSAVQNVDVPSRVRFVNYYTASTGRIKKAKSPLRRLSPRGNKSQTSLSPAAIDNEQRGRSRHEDGDTQPQSSRSASPQISLEEHSDDGVLKKEVEMPDSGDEDWNDAAETLTIGETSIVSGFHGSEHKSENASESLSPTSTLSTSASLPPVPEPPTPPPPLDMSYIQDSETRKLVEREHARAVKSYEKAVKDREKVIRDRAKFQEKQERKSMKSAEKTAKDAEKANQKAERDAQKAAKPAEPPRELTHNEREAQRLKNERKRMEAEGRRIRGERSPQREFDLSTAPLQTTSTISSQGTASLEPMSSLAPSDASRSTSPQPQSKGKPKKDRKFCTLPPKDANGQRDPLWVRVFMENVDEVGAHCGLFFVDERYERLVGEVADRIEGWVREDMNCFDLD